MFVCLSVCGVFFVRLTCFLSSSLARAAYGEILSWIGRVLKLKSKVTIKFSNVFTHLSDKGYIVRAVFLTSA